MTQPINSVNTSVRQCGKYIKSTCVPWEFEFINDPCSCDTCKSFFDLCDTPACQPNSILVSPQVCSWGECWDQLRWITFAQFISELDLWDRYVWATFDDLVPWELEQKLRICPANSLSWLLKLVPKTAWTWNKYLELCIDETKIAKNVKLTELKDWPLSLWSCSNININWKNIQAYSQLVTAPWATSWSRRCPRQAYNAGIYLDWIYEATFPTDEVNVITWIYPLMEHLPWNHPSMSTNAWTFGNAIRIPSDWLYELEAKLAYHVNSYVNAIKLEIFNVGTWQSLWWDKDWVQANDNLYTIPWADWEQSTDWTASWMFNAQMNNKINNLQVKITVWLTANTIIWIRSRVSTQVSTTPLTTEDWKILVWPVSVYSADDPKWSTYLYVKEVPMITY